jgi:hypothetical protein
LPHESDEACFRVVDREIAAAIRQLRVLTKRKGQLLRDRIRLKQRQSQNRAGALGVRGRPPSSPLAARRFSRFK